MSILVIRMRPGSGTGALSCERRESRAGARSQAGAPLSWTSERADTFFVCERARKAAATKRQPQRAERAMQTERAEGFFPLRATTTAADSKRDARAAQKWGAANSLLHSILCGPEHTAY